MKAIKITTDDEISVVDIHEPTLKGMQKEVDGYIQTVRGYNLNDLDVPEKRNLLMIVNEDGLNKELLYNEIAADLADDYIVGDVLIMAEGFVNGDPDIVGLTDEQVNALVEVFKEDYGMEVENAQ
jgi:malonyl CoA-acyl carrier protein transacylase